MILPRSLVLLELGWHLCRELLLDSENGLIYGLDAFERRPESLFQKLVNLSIMNLDMFLELRPAGSSWLAGYTIVAPNSPLPRHMC